MDLGCQGVPPHRRAHERLREFLEAVERLGTHQYCYRISLLPPQTSDIQETRIRHETRRSHSVSMCAHPLFLRKRFDRVIVDEAGQLDEPQRSDRWLLRRNSYLAATTSNFRLW